MGWAARLPRRKIVTVSPDPIVTPQQDKILRGASSAALLLAAAAAMAPPTLDLRTVKTYDSRENRYKPKRKRR